MVELFIGTSCSPDLSMTGIWGIYNNFLAFCTPPKLQGMGKTGCVVSPVRIGIFEVLLLGSYYWKPTILSVEKHLED